MNLFLPLFGTPGIVAILIKDGRTTIGKLRLGKKNHKVQMIWRTPTTYKSVGITKKDYKEIVEKDIIILFAVPKGCNPEYYNKKGSTKTDEHDFYVVRPKKHKERFLGYDASDGMIHFRLEQMKEKINLDEIKKGKLQLKLTDEILWRD